MNTDGNGSLRVDSVFLSDRPGALLFNSTPAEFRLDGVLLITLSGQARGEGSVTPSGAIRPHPCSSVAGLSFTSAALEVGQTIQRLQRRERIHVQRRELIHHGIGACAVAEEGELAGVAG